MLLNKTYLKVSTRTAQTKCIFVISIILKIILITWVTKTLRDWSTRQQLLVVALTDSHTLVFTEDSPSLRSVSEILLFTTAKMVCGEGQLFACRLIYAIHKKHK